MTQKQIIDPLERFGKELGPDEEVIWNGQPVSQMAHAKSAKMTGIYGAVVLLFAIFWTISIAFSADFQTEGSNSALWVGLFIMLVGLIQTGMPIFAYINARRIHYALTNHRILIYNQFAGEEMQSLALHTLEAPVNNAHQDGSCDIILLRKKPGFFSLNRANKTVGFIGLSAHDAKMVSAKLNNLNKNFDADS